MNHHILLNQTACEQARQINAKTLSAQSLLSQQQDAIAELNPTINAFVQVGKAVASDELPEMSALAGSTFAVKDNIDVQGIPTHGGMRALHAQPAAQDASVVARLKAAGMVCLGKLNMHAMALGATNHNTDFGNCYNPVRAGYTPGGSSGGSAAAVAAGLCGLALGTDTLGSVRIPAAYCGVVGFKPSFGALPTDGVIPLSRLLDHVGILARGVEDVIAAFAAMTGSKQVTSAHLPSSPGSSILNLALPAGLDELGLTDEVRHAFEQGTQRLQRAGHILHPVDFSDCGFPALRKAGLFLCEAELRDTLSQTLQSHRGDMPPDLLGMLDFIGQRSAQGPDKARRHFAGLDERGAACQQGRNGIDERQQEREVPRRDNADECIRYPQALGGKAGNGDVARRAALGKQRWRLLAPTRERVAHASQFRLRFNGTPGVGMERGHHGRFVAA